MSNEEEKKSFSELLKEAIDTQEYILIEPENGNYYNARQAIYNDEYSAEDYESVLGTPIIELNAIETSYMILESFELHGEFLDPIPYQEKKKIINNQLLPWINSYCTNHVVNLMKVKFAPKGEAGKEISKNINVIEKFELMLLGKFSFLPVGMAIENDKYLDISINLEEDTGKKETLRSIQALLKDAEDLKNDLKNKIFKIFPKHKYYNLAPVPKTGLTAILDNAITKYKLKSHNPHKKQLIDNI